jgi:fluoroquinolone transport system permease protein
LMTMFSLAVAVFFRNLSEWFFVGVAILLVNSLPMFSYAMPSFAPAWVTLIPSYPAVFASRDVLFYGSGLLAISPTVLYLVVLNLLALAAAYAAVRFKLLEEGR